MLEHVAGRAQAEVLAFLDRHRAILGSRSEGLIDLLERWARGPRSLTESTGQLMPLLATANKDPLLAAARAAAHLHGRGIEGAWRVELDRPHRLRFARCLSPRATAFEVDAGAERIELRGSIVLHRRGEQLDFDRPEKLAGGKILRAEYAIISPWALDVMSGPPPFDLSPLSHDALQRYADAAIDRLAQAAPIYLDWVDGVLRDFFPLEQHGGGTQSGTLGQMLGTVAVSFPATPVQLGELLVHEASHQYLEIAERVAPVDDGSDTHQYWSPARREPRSIERILTAYHAFANIMLWWRAAVAAGLDDDGYAENNLERWRPRIAEMSGYLSQTKSLTPIGRALFEPLQERVG